MRALLLLLAAALLASCSKSESSKPPQIFLPRVIGPQGEDLDSRHASLCQGAQLNVQGEWLTQENFQKVFRCANYDDKLASLSPLFQSQSLPPFLKNLNLVLQSEHTRSLQDGLRSWLGTGAEGSSKADRLLPIAASIIKNPAFQDFLPVASEILLRGSSVWRELLPGLADVLHTEQFPDNLDFAFTALRSFSAAAEEGKGGSPVKELARFLKSDVDGKTASYRALELADGIRSLDDDGTQIYSFLEHASKKGTFLLYFLNAGHVRGESTDSALNGRATHPSEICPFTDGSPQQQQRCAVETLFKRPAEGEAPIIELAQLVAELQKAHPELLPKLLLWYKANSDRVVGALGDYVMQAQLQTHVSQLSLADFLRKYAKDHGMNFKEPMDSAKFSAFVSGTCGTKEFTDWAKATVNQINRSAYGEKNRKLLAESKLQEEILALFLSPGLQDFSAKLIPPGKTLPLELAITKFQNNLRKEETEIPFGEKTQNLNAHLSGIWTAKIAEHLGEHVALRYFVELSHNAADELMKKFGPNSPPLAEWYFNSPYGDPETTEMILSLALSVNLLAKYEAHKGWLRGPFADEVFGENESDKRAFQMLIGQIPNIVLYVRSGMARSGADLTRALALDKDGFLVRSYVNLIVKAVETGWLSKAVRLMEAFQQQPEQVQKARAPIPAELLQRGDYTLGAEALQRIFWSLISPAKLGDYSTSTLGRLAITIASLAGEGRREETERFLLSTAGELEKAPDEKLNSFFQNLPNSKPAGTAAERRETYGAIADFLRNPKCPELVTHLSGLFRDNAVKPALDFFAQKVDDGTLPRFLLFVRRVLGFAAPG